MSVTIAYLHTSHVLIPMFRELSKAELPDVEQFHMVDESLIRNTIREQRLTKTTIRRVLAMVQSARDGGADAVMVTCSSIGPAASLARSVFDFPVIRVDEAMAEEAVRAGRRIGVAATLRTTLEPTVELLREKAKAAQREVVLLEALCEGAFEAVLAGDTATHDRILADSLLRLADTVDVVVLAQASMARVVDALPAGAIRVPIHTSPALAVQRARAILFPESAGVSN
ncbi:MAG TPA: aspartate/glutamate racemase family protein [Candidatus Sulfopaludibacter sp.]|nr:aspartate/glutamate racemase family protein [Candidatus Sulfopaludibacter sp.]